MSGNKLPIYLPDKQYYWCNNQCEQEGDISDDVRDQWAHAVIEAEVVRKVESRGTGNVV